MKALVKTAYGVGNLEVMDVDKPEPKQDEVVIKVKAAAVCGSDINFYLDKLKLYNPPVILGHEVSGIVEEIGEKVKDVKINDEVSIAANPYACGNCFYCWSGKENLCLKRKGLGYEVNGGFAEYLKVPESTIVKKPNAISFTEAAMMDINVAVHAVMDRSALRPRDYVVIIGPGFEGLCVLQVVKLFNPRHILIAGLKKDKNRLGIAKSLNVDRTVFGDNENLKDIVMEDTSEVGADVVFECSGSVDAINRAVEITRRDGTITAIGMTPRSIQGSYDAINIFHVVAKQISLIGTRSYTHVNCEWSMKALLEGKITLKPLAGMVVPLEEWLEAFKKQMSGEIVKAILTL